MYMYTSTTDRPVHTAVQPLFVCVTYCVVVQYSRTSCTIAPRSSSARHARGVRGRHLNCRRPQALGARLVVGGPLLLPLEWRMACATALLSAASVLASLRRKVRKELRRSLGASGTPACRRKAACTSLVLHTRYPPRLSPQATVRVGAGLWRVVRQHADASSRMTFKTRPSTYRLSLAPTGRACCRGCKRRVERGELRITITAFVRPGRSTCLVRCCECIDAKFARAVLNVYGTAARMPADAGVATAAADGVRAALAQRAADKSGECAVE